MSDWLESIYSDGTSTFVDNKNPKIGDTVKVSVRFYEDAPVENVFVKSNPNGQNLVIEAKKDKVENGLVYYTAELPIHEDRTQYQFYLTTKDKIYYYTQNGVTSYMPDTTYDFVLLSDYEQPEWVKDQVFYQIFPERFYNGNPDNDVLDNEYSVNGHPTIQMKDWNQEPLDYQDSFCLDFYGGDLEGIKEKIPYLKELGVTALYLNPIFEAPSCHKYDCIDYFHVDEHFGGDQALADLSEALHENGMKLILDVSINHTGSNHKWFNRDGVFYDLDVGAYNNPNAPEREYYFFDDETNNYFPWMGVLDMPTLNYTSDSLRKKVYKDEDSVVKKWLAPPYNIDGWRFDVADVFGRNDEIQLSHELWPEIRESIRSVNPQAYILAEEWCDAPANLQGNEWDSAMNYYGCARPIREFVGECDLFNRFEPKLANIQTNQSAQDLNARIWQHLAKLPFEIWENQFNLLGSHDCSRLQNNPNIHPGDKRGAVILQFNLIGAPCIYYGDEIDLNGRLGSNEGCRYPMNWDADLESNEMYQLYSKLAHLKQESKALREGGMKTLYAEDNVFSIARFFEDEILITVMSKSDEEETIILPIGAVGSLGIESTTDIFDLPLQLEKIDDRHVQLTVPPHTTYLIDASNKKEALED